MNLTFRGPGLDHLSLKWATSGGFHVRGWEESILFWLVRETKRKPRFGSLFRHKVVGGSSKL